MILPFSHPQCIDRKCFQALFHTPMTLQPPPPILLYIRGINIFVGRRHYKNFSTRKFFQRKFHITKISRFTVFRILGCNYTPDRHHRGNNIVELSMTSSPLQVYHPQASNTSLTWMTMVAGYLLRSSAVSCGRSSQWVMYPFHEAWILTAACEKNDIVSTHARLPGLQWLSGRDRRPGWWKQKVEEEGCWGVCVCKCMQWIPSYHHLGRIETWGKAILC